MRFKVLLIMKNNCVPMNNRKRELLRPNFCIFFSTGNNLFQCFRFKFCVFNDNLVPRNPKFLMHNRAYKYSYITVINKNLTFQLCSCLNHDICVF